MIPGSGDNRHRAKENQSWNTGNKKPVQGNNTPCQKASLTWTMLYKIKLYDYDYFRVIIVITSIHSIIHFGPYNASVSVIESQYALLLYIYYINSTACTIIIAPWF